MSKPKMQITKGMFAYLKTKLHWHDWTIHTRLLVIAFLPVLYLFVSLLAYSYYARSSEVQEELETRANTISTALADGLEYHVLSGNISGIRQMISGVIESDQKIFRIDILDAQKKQLCHVENSRKVIPENTYSERPIKRQLIWVKLITPNPVTPRENSGGQQTTAVKTNDVLAYVRVTMTGTQLIKTQRQRFFIEVLISILALNVSAWLIWYLSSSLTRPLRTAIEALKEISNGQTATQITVDTGGEIGDLQNSINEMARNLHQAQQNLEQKVAERTKELSDSRNLALKADAEKRRLIHKVNSIVEAERQSIAVEIHDELNASLIAIRLESEFITRTCNKVAADEKHAEIVDEIRLRAKSVIKLALNLYANGRNLVRRLRPEVLDMMGLDGAIEEMLRLYNETQNQCEFHFNADGDFKQLDADVAISAYRIIQEALSNIIKHAHASSVSVDLNLSMQETSHPTLSITVTDNGIGFDPNQQQSGIGISGMRERVLVLDGSFKLESEPGHGCTLEIALPV